MNLNLFPKVLELGKILCFYLQKKKKKKGKILCDI